MKPTMVMETNPNGVSIWKNKKWVLDASTLLSDGDIEIDLNEFDIKISRKHKKAYLKAKNVRLQKWIDGSGRTT